MTDIQFKLKSVPYSYRTGAARSAVMHQLLPTFCKSRTGVFLDGVQQLQRMWRARVSALHSVGWRMKPSREASALDIQKTRNCRPAMVMSLPQTFHCEQVKVCPFCYARWVAKCFNLIDARLLHLSQQVLSKTEQERGFYLPKLQVLLRSRTQSLSASQVTTEAWMQCIREKRPTVLTAPHAYGVFASTIISPGEGENLIVRNTQLFAFPHEFNQWQDRELLPEGGEQETLINPSRKELSRKFGRLVAYPPALLRGDPKLTAEILNAWNSTRFRMSITKGAFYGDPPSKVSAAS